MPVCSVLGPPANTVNRDGGGVSAAAETPPPSRFAVFAGGPKTEHTGITPQQRQHLSELTSRYTKKTAGSQKFTQAHRVPLADPRAASGFRSEWKDMVYPIVVSGAAGSKLTDIDGNEYIDLVNGFGQTALGHSPDRKS